MGYNEVYALVKEGGLLSLVVIEALAIRWLYLRNERKREEKDKEINNLLENRHIEYVELMKEQVKLQEATVNSLCENNRLNERVERSLERFNQGTV